MSEAATIDTAPRDGTHILGKDGFWREMWLVRDQYEGEFWRDEFDSEPEPTHWAPLPDADAVAVAYTSKDAANVMRGGTLYRGNRIPASSEPTPECVVPFYLANPSAAVKTSPEVGEMVAELEIYEANSATSLRIKESEFFSKIIALLIALDAERGRLREALIEFVSFANSMWFDEGNCTEEEHEAYWKAKEAITARSALPASDEVDKDYDPSRDM